MLNDLITNPVHDTNRVPKLTVFLWHNDAMLEYIHKNVLNEMSEDSLSRLMSVIKNHLSEFHHPTQSIVADDKMTVKSLIKSQLRLSAIELDEVRLILRD